MNGNPTQKQKEYHNELREMYFEKEMHNGVGELHHIFGSKAKFKLLTEAGIDKAGEWFVIMIPRSVHLSINEYSFEAERSMFLEQQRKYSRHFGKPSPVPEEVIKLYRLMTSKQSIVKAWS